MKNVGVLIGALTFLGAAQMIWAEGDGSAEPGMGLATDASTSTATPSSSLKATLKVGTAVENKEVVGEAESFPATTPQLVAWSLIEGSETPTTITHEWVHNGVTVATVNLDVKSARYRTNSRITISDRTGSWKVEVKDSSGAVLAS